MIWKSIVWKAYFCGVSIMLGYIYNMYRLQIVIFKGLLTKIFITKGVDNLQMSIYNAYFATDKSFKQQANINYTV